MIAEQDNKDCPMAWGQRKRPSGQLTVTDRASEASGKVYNLHVYKPCQFCVRTHPNLVTKSQFSDSVRMPVEFTSILVTLVC